MGKFYKETMIGKDFSDGDLKKLRYFLNLIDKSEFRAELVDLLSFDSIAEDVVAIPGLSILTKRIISRDESFVKFDRECHISDARIESVFDDASINITLKENESNDEPEVTATTIYNSKADYLNWIFHIERFSNFCIKEGHEAILIDNIDRLNKKYEKQKDLRLNFRLLRDSEGSYFVRAVTSAARYHDYNIRFSLFVTIVALHLLQKRMGISFKITYCEFNESSIRVFFEKQGNTNLPNVGSFSFGLEMSNDEIKREAFRISSIITLKSNRGGEPLHLKSNSAKQTFVTIRHDIRPETAVRYLSQLERLIDLAEQEIKDDMSAIATIKKPDELRHMLMRKIERSRSSSLSDDGGALKSKMLGTLGQTISKIADLITMMQKVDELVTDLELKEQLRYYFYDILRPKRNL